MFSTEEANRLIRLAKRTEGHEVLIRVADPKTRIYLRADEEPEYQFLFQINRSSKLSFKISLHHQEDQTNVGLLRIDYRGVHENPIDASRAPEVFRPYLGKRFGIDEPHIHLHVEGYKSLAWALPLSDYGFGVLKVESSEDFAKAVVAFSQEINIVSQIVVEQVLI